MDEKIREIFERSIIENNIPGEDYVRWNVKKGLRNEDGTGVLIGLTRIADVIGYEMVDGKKTDCEGELLYRGIKLTEIAKNIGGGRIGAYEEIAFLILFGHLPNEAELAAFTKELRENYEYKPGFINQYILNNKSPNVMNKIQTALLAMYVEDENADDCSVENTLRQGLNVIAKMPQLICYSYAVKHHHLDGESLIIHHVDSSKSIAENILSLTRPDQKYSEKEAELLDLMLVLHMDHGAGNNSTFTNIVVSSTETDLYSSLSASVGALKGPRHGGANISAANMMQAVIDEIGLDATDAQIEEIINRILNKDFFDKKGLVYGMGHAIYTLSDPRAEILKEKVREVYVGGLERFEFYQRFEEIAKRVIYKEHGKAVCANVDFYSGLVYSALGIPADLYTPLFICARTVGWLAHNIENKLYCNRIVRPAGKYVGEEHEYIKPEDRK